MPQEKIDLLADGVKPLVLELLRQNSVLRPNFNSFAVVSLASAGKPLILREFIFGGEFFEIMWC